MTSHRSGTLLGLDIGERRIGVAVVRLDVRIPRPLTTVEGSGQPAQPDFEAAAVRQIATLAEEHDAQAIVAGWPRGLAGQHTAQTAYVEAFVAALRQAIGRPVHLQDEALTSQKAEAELAARRKPYTRGDIDALAATFILEDYVHEHYADQPGAQPYV